MKQALCNAAPVQPQDAQRCSQRVDELFANVRNQNEAGAVVQLLNKEDVDKFSAAPEKFDKDVCARRGGVYDLNGSQGKPGPGPTGSTPPKEGEQPTDSDKNKDKEVAPVPGGGDSGSSVATTVLGGLFGTALTAAGGAGLYFFAQSAEGAALLTSLGTSLASAPRQERRKRLRLQYLGLRLGLERKSVRLSRGRLHEWDIGW
ncbi:hypothetical protein J3458_012931 [Metarhizium acridum]|uniref:uncharacterized protein n=1 Tax=Metarhizium acridum TaxID=92637 RepID=UPI001C6CF6BC|nr:hypothetical protein J3458_012931 [Metarhizium acridum]